MLSLTPTLDLESQIDDIPRTLSIGITVGKWTQIYASYIYTYGGIGEASVTIDGVLTSGSPAIPNGHGPGVFGTADTIGIGPGFVGQVRRIQIYSPTILHLYQRNCLPSSCDVDTNNWVFSNCLLETCTTPGYYTSFGNCESIY